MTKQTHSKTPVLTLKITALTVIFSMLFSSVCPAQISLSPGLRPLENPLIKIPAEFGRSEAYFPGSTGKTIIYLQDAHDSLQAQENIAGIIRHLTQSGVIRTVFEEGYEGPVPTDSYFEEIQGPELREKVSYYLMDKLRIGGAEYAHINRQRAESVQRIADRKDARSDELNAKRSTLNANSDFRLIGADSLKLHSENISAYGRAARVKEDVRADLRAMEQMLSRLAEKKFPRKAKDWLKCKELYDSGKLNLLDYVKRIQSLDAESVLSKYPNLELLTSASTSGEHKKLDTLKVEELMLEIKGLENEIMIRILPDSGHRDIFNHLTSIRLIGHLQDIQAASAEFEAARNQLRGFKTETLSAFLADQTNEPILLSKDWESKIQAAVDFYETANRRDDSIEMYLNNFLNHPDEKTAVLVFGGFHKDRILNILRKKGIACQPVIPVMTHESERHQKYYQQLMAGDFYPFEEGGQASKASRVLPLFRFNRETVRAELREISRAASQLSGDEKELWIRELDKKLSAQKMTVRPELRNGESVKEDFDQVALKHKDLSARYIKTRLKFMEQFKQTVELRQFLLRRNMLFFFSAFLFYFMVKSVAVSLGAHPDLVFVAFVGASIWFWVRHFSAVADLFRSLSTSDLNTSLILGELGDSAVQLGEPLGVDPSEHMTSELKGAFQRLNTEYQKTSSVKLNQAEFDAYLDPFLNSLQQYLALRGLMLSDEKYLGYSGDKVQQLIQVESLLVDLMADMGRFVRGGAGDRELFAKLYQVHIPELSAAVDSFKASLDQEKIGPLLAEAHSIELMNLNLEKMPPAEKVWTFTSADRVHRYLNQLTELLYYAPDVIEQRVKKPGSRLARAFLLVTVLNIGSYAAAALADYFNTASKLVWEGLFMCAAYLLKFYMYVVLIQYFFSDSDRESSRKVYSKLEHEVKNQVAVFRASVLKQIGVAEPVEDEALNLAAAFRALRNNFSEHKPASSSLNIEDWVRDEELFLVTYREFLGLRSSQLEPLSAVSKDLRKLLKEIDFGLDELLMNMLRFTLSGSSDDSALFQIYKSDLSELKKKMTQVINIHKPEDHDPGFWGAFRRWAHGRSELRIKGEETFKKQAGRPELRINESWLGQKKLEDELKGFFNWRVRDDSSLRLTRRSLGSDYDITAEVSPNGWAVSIHPFSKGPERLRLAWQQELDGRYAFIIYDFLGRATVIPGFEETNPLLSWEYSPGNNETKPTTGMHFTMTMSDELLKHLPERFVASYQLHQRRVRGQGPVTWEIKFQEVRPELRMVNPRSVSQRFLDYLHERNARGREVPAYYKNYRDESSKGILRVSKGLKGKAMLLGFGHGTEYTNEAMEALAEQFETIELVDLDSRIVRQSLDRLKAYFQSRGKAELISKFKVVEEDLSGMMGYLSSQMDAVIQTSPSVDAALPQIIRIIQHGPEEENFLPLSGARASFISSSMLLTQPIDLLDTYIEMELAKRFKMNPQSLEGFFTSEDYTAGKRTLNQRFQMRHFTNLRRWLNPEGRIYFATDTHDFIAQLDRSPAGLRAMNAPNPRLHQEGIRTLERLFAVEPLSEWLWFYDPQFETEGWGEVFQVRSYSLAPRAELRMNEERVITDSSDFLVKQQFQLFHQEREHIVKDLLRVFRLQPKQAVKIQRFYDRLPERERMVVVFSIQHWRETKAWPRNKDATAFLEAVGYGPSFDKREIERIKKEFGFDRMIMPVIQEIRDTIPRTEGSRLEGEEGVHYYSYYVPQASGMAKLHAVINALDIDAELPKQMAETVSRKYTDDEIAAGLFPSGEDQETRLWEYFHRLPAIIELGRRKASRYADDLARILETSRSVPVLQETLLALARMQARDLIPAIEKKMEGEEGRTSEVRIAAIRALQMLDSKESIPAIAERLQDKNTMVRLRALQALGHFNAVSRYEKTIREMMEGDKQDTSDTVRRTASSLMKKHQSGLAGQDPSAMRPELRTLKSEQDMPEKEISFWREWGETLILFLTKFMPWILPKKWRWNYQQTISPAGLSASDDFYYELMKSGPFVDWIKIKVKGVWVSARFNAAGVERTLNQMNFDVTASDFWRVRVASSPDSLFDIRKVFKEKPDVKDVEAFKSALFRSIPDRSQQITQSNLSTDFQMGWTILGALEGGRATLEKDLRWDSKTWEAPAVEHIQSIECFWRLPHESSKSLKPIRRADFESDAVFREFLSTAILEGTAIRVVYEPQNPRAEMRQSADPYQLQSLAEVQSPEKLESFYGLVRRMLQTTTEMLPDEIGDEIASLQNLSYGHKVNYLILFEGSEAVGYRVFAQRPDQSEVVGLSLYVSPSKEGRGVGRRLNEASLKYLFDLGYERFTTNVADSDEARRFHESILDRQQESAVDVRRGKQNQLRAYTLDLKRYQFSPRTELRSQADEKRAEIWRKIAQNPLLFSHFQGDTAEVQRAAQGVRQYWANSGEQDYDFAKFQRLVYHPIYGYTGTLKGGDSLQIFQLMLHARDNTWGFFHPYTSSMAFMLVNGALTAYGISVFDDRTRILNPGFQVLKEFREKGHSSQIYAAYLKLLLGHFNPVRFSLSPAQVTHTLAVEPVKAMAFYLKRGFVPEKGGDVLRRLTDEVFMMLADASHPIHLGKMAELARLLGEYQPDERIFWTSPELEPLKNAARPELRMAAYLMFRISLALRTRFYSFWLSRHPEMDASRPEFSMPAWIHQIYLYTFAALTKIWQDRGQLTRKKALELIDRYIRPLNPKLDLSAVLTNDDQLITPLDFGRVGQAFQDQIFGPRGWVVTPSPFIAGYAIGEIVKDRRFEVTTPMNFKMPVDFVEPVTPGTFGNMMAGASGVLIAADHDREKGDYFRHVRESGPPTMPAVGTLGNVILYVQKWFEYALFSTGTEEEAQQKQRQMDLDEEISHFDVKRTFLALTGYDWMPFHSDRDDEILMELMVRPDSIYFEKFHELKTPQERRTWIEIVMEVEGKINVIRRSISPSFMLLENVLHRIAGENPGMKISNAAKESYAHAYSLVTMSMSGALVKGQDDPVSWARYFMGIISNGMPGLKRHDEQIRRAADAVYQKSFISIEERQKKIQAARAELRKSLVERDHLKLNGREAKRVPFNQNRFNQSRSDFMTLLYLIPENRSYGISDHRKSLTSGPDAFDRRLSFAALDYAGKPMALVTAAPIDDKTVRVSRLITGAFYRNIGLEPWLLYQTLSEARRLGYEKVFVKSGEPSGIQTLLEQTEKEFAEVTRGKIELITTREDRRGNFYQVFEHGDSAHDNTLGHVTLSAGAVSEQTRQWYAETVTGFGEGLEILSLGPGTGIIEEGIQKLGHRIFAVEGYGPFVEQSRARGVETVQGDMTQPPVGDRKFDLILMAESIGHVKNLEALFKRLRTHLKPGGRILITIASEGGQARQRFAAETGFDFYSDEEISAAIRSAGLDIEEQGKFKSQVNPTNSLPLHFFITAPLPRAELRAEEPTEADIDGFVEAAMQTHTAGIQLHLSQNEWSKQRPFYSVGQKREGSRKALSRAINETLAQYVPDKPAKVYDVGAGEGALPSFLDSSWTQNGRYVPFDINPKFLRTLRGRGFASESIQGSVYEFSQHVQNADVIMGLDSFDTFDELEKALAEMYKALKPGGKLIIFSSLRVDLRPFFVGSFADEFKKSGILFAPVVNSYYRNEADLKKVLRLFARFQLKKDRGLPYAAAYRDYMELSRQLEVNMNLEVTRPRFEKALKQAGFKLLADPLVKRTVLTNREHRHLAAIGLAESGASMADKINVVHNRHGSVNYGWAPRYEVGGILTPIPEGHMVEDLEMLAFVAEKPVHVTEPVDARLKVKKQTGEVIPLEAGSYEGLQSYGFTHLRVHGIPEPVALAGSGKTWLDQVLDVQTRPGSTQRFILILDWEQRTATLTLELPSQVPADKPKEASGKPAVDSVLKRFGEKTRALMALPIAAQDESVAGLIYEMALAEQNPDLRRDLTTIPMNYDPYKRTVMKGDRDAFSRQEHLTSFVMLRALGLHLLDKAFLAKEGEAFSEADLNYLEGLIADYNRQPGVKMPLDIPSLLYYSRSHVFQDNARFRDISIQFTKLPRRYAIPAVALHNYMQGAHLDGYSKNDTYHEFDITRAYLSFTFEELKKTDLSDDEREALELGALRLLIFLLRFLVSDFGRLNQPYILEIRGKFPEELKQALWIQARENIDTIEALFKKYGSRLTGYPEGHTKPADIENEDILLASLMWAYYTQAEPYLLENLPASKWTIEQLYLHRGNPETAAYLNQMVEDVIRRQAEVLALEPDERHDPPVMIFGDLQRNIRLIMDQIIPGLRQIPLVNLKTGEEKRAELRSQTAQTRVPLSEVLKNPAIKQTPAAQESSLIREVGGYLQNLPDLDLNEIFRTSGVTFPDGIREKLLKGFKTQPLKSQLLAGMGKMMSSGGLILVEVNPDLMNRLTRDDQNYSLVWTDSAGRFYMLRRFYDYLAQMTDENERIKTASALFARLIMFQRFREILKDGGVKQDAKLLSKLRAGVRAAEDAVYSAAPLQLAESKVDLRQRGFVYQNMFEREERFTRYALPRFDWGPRISRLEALMNRLLTLQDRIVTQQSVTRTDRQEFEDIDASYKLDEETQALVAAKLTDQNVEVLSRNQERFMSAYLSLKRRIATSVRLHREGKLVAEEYENRLADLNQRANTYLNKLIKVEFALIQALLGERRSIKKVLSDLISHFEDKERELKWSRIREIAERGVTEVFVQSADDEFLRVKMLKDIVDKRRPSTGAVERIETRWNQEERYYLATIKQLLTALMDKESAVTQNPELWRTRLISYLTMRKVDLGAPAETAGVNDLAAGLYLHPEIARDVFKRIREWAKQKTVQADEPNVKMVSLLVRDLLPDETGYQEGLKRIRYQNLFNFYRSRDHVVETYDREHRNAWMAIGFLTDLELQLRHHKTEKLPEHKLRSAARDLEEVAKWVRLAQVAEKTRIRSLVRVARENLRLGQYAVAIAKAAEARTVLETIFLKRIERMSRYVARHRHSVLAELESPLHKIRQGIRTGAAGDFKSALRSIKKFKARHLDGYKAAEDEPGYKRAKGRFTHSIRRLEEAVAANAVPDSETLRLVLTDLYRVQYDIQHKYEKVSELADQAQSIERTIADKVQNDLKGSRSELRQTRESYPIASPALPHARTADAGEIILVDYQDMAHRFSDAQIKEVFYAARRGGENTRVIIYGTDSTEDFGKWLMKLTERSHPSLHLDRLRVQTDSFERITAGLGGFAGQVIRLSSWNAAMTHDQYAAVLTRNGIRRSQALSFAYRDETSGTLGLGLKTLEDMRLDKTLPEFMARDQAKGWIYVTDRTATLPFETQIQADLAFSRAA